MTAEAKPAAPRVFSIVGRGLRLNTSEDAAGVCAELEALLPDVEEVHVSGNTFGVDAAKAFAASLAKAQRLRVANLSDMFTGRLREEIPFALEALGDALVDKAALERVDLSDNAFGPAGAQPLYRLFAENTHIAEILLNNNGLGVAGGTIFAQALLASAEKSHAERPGEPTALRVLVCGRNRLENGSMPALSAALEAHGHLREVRMKQNGIRPEGIATLLAALAKNSFLEVLDLQDNTFTASGTAGLVAALHQWHHLREINVGDCLLSAAGSRDLAVSLSKKPNLHRLEHVHLGYAEMEEDAALLLVDAVRQMTILATLDLNGNAFRASGPAARAISAAITQLGKDVEQVLLELDDMDVSDSEDSEGDSEGSEEDYGEEAGEEAGEETGKKDGAVDELAAALDRAL